MAEKEQYKRRFLVSFSYNTDKGFGFGNWYCETEGDLIGMKALKEFEKQVCYEKGYNSLVILAVSEVGID